MISQNQMKKILLSVIIIIILIVLLILTTKKDQEKPINEPPNIVLAPQYGLPTEVSKTRQAIARAAKNKNYEKLSELAGSEFKYSFGSDYEGGFVGYLKHLEELGANPLGEMVTLLSLPYEIDE